MNTNDLRRKAFIGKSAAERAAAAAEYADQIAKATDAMTSEDAPTNGLWEPTKEGLEAAVAKAQAGIKAPFVKCSGSSLGGLARSAIMIAISLDPKESWANNIFENGRSGRMSISREGVIEHFSGSFRRPGEPKYVFRKARARTLDAAIQKINAFVASAPQTSKAARPAMHKGSAQGETIAVNKFVEGSRYYVGKDGLVWYTPGGKTASNTGKSVDEFVADVKAGRVKAKLTGKFA